MKPLARLKKAQIVVASCDRRTLELEQMKHYLAGNGYRVSPSDWLTDKDADLIILSTCGFTKAAEDFGFTAYQRLLDTKKPSATIVFGGCVPEINPGRVRLAHSGATISPKRYAELDEVIQASQPFSSFVRPNVVTRDKRARLVADLAACRDILKTFDGSLSGVRQIAGRFSNAFNRRFIQKRLASISQAGTFYIQIQEGCSMKCSYCAIRTAIGGLRSRRAADILAEFQSGLDQGYRRFQLVGDNAGSFGLDNRQSFSDLLTRIADMEGDFRLDLTDINPVYVPRVYPAVLKLLEAGRLASFYVPIQSGSPRVLQRMNRDCDLGEVRAMLQKIKRMGGPDLKMGTSVIVGYPSETEEELGQTIDFCQDVGFDWVWCHSFSCRPDSPAASDTDQIAPEDILARAWQVKARLGGRVPVTTAEDTKGSRTCQG